MVIKTYYNILYSKHTWNVDQSFTHETIINNDIYPSQATTIFEDPMFPFISHDFYVSEKGQ
jgi:hypothetical protein